MAIAPAEPVRGMSGKMWVLVATSIRAISPFEDAVVQETYTVFPSGVIARPLKLVGVPTSTTVTTEFVATSITYTVEKFEGLPALGLLPFATYKKGDV